jgi:taurine dioxygenase
VWGDGDLMIWDNRTLLHQASAVPKGQSSVSYRIGIYDGLAFYRQP